MWRPWAILLRDGQVVMVDSFAQWTLTYAMSAPVWAAIAGLVVVTGALALMRARLYGNGASLLQGAFVVIAVLAGWWALDQFVRRDVAIEQRVLEARAIELTVRALAPGSALACLDAIAGDAVEEACEKALFANPEAAAAAVSYVAAQLSLLAAASEQAQRAGQRSGALAGAAHLHRAIETDRFGIAAHVLAIRDGCTPDSCNAFAWVQDSRHLSANLAERPFDAHVARHAAAWPQVPSRPVVGNLPGTAPASTPATVPKLPNNLYFPSASSISPVSIMTAEPAAPPRHDTTGAGEPGSGPASKGRAGAPAGPPANPASVFCVQSGGKSETSKGLRGQHGVCRLPDGRVVEEWSYFREMRGKVAPRARTTEF